MQKNRKKIKQIITDFFKCKNILCDVDNTENSTILISFLKGEREYYFHIENKFNTNDWDALNKELEIEYQKVLAK
jgi:hypothetical protein